MSDFDRKLLFVTGKGGVGKTTVSVALAKALTRAGRRVLLALTEVAQAPTLLGVEALSSDIEPVGGGLSAVLLEPDAALREYARMTLGSKALARALLDNRYSKSFLAAIPGLHAWACLGKAWYHAVEEQDGALRFDTVIVDAPATGHGLEMLRVPRVISEAAAPGLLKRDAERAWAMLTDAEQSGVVVVTVPETLPMQESLELIDDLEQLGLSPTRLVLNGRYRDHFVGSAPAALDSLQTAILDQEGQEVLALARRRLSSERAQQRVEAELEGLSVPLSVLSWLETAGSPLGIDELATELVGG
jgi:anion-transporting  ArsA/GET3 family ATPase